MAYDVNFTRQALRELETINEPNYSKIKRAITALALNARPAGCKQLKGSKSFRIRVGDYRVIYDIYDTQLLIDVITIGNRKDVYEWRSIYQPNKLFNLAIPLLLTSTFEPQCNSAMWLSFS